MMSGTRWAGAEAERHFLLPANLGTGEIFMIRWRRRGGSDSAVGKKPALWVIFSSRSIYSRLHLNPTEADSLLPRSHLTQPDKKNVIAHPCRCSSCIVAARTTAGHYGKQQILCDSTLGGVMSPGRRFHQDSLCQVIVWTFGHMRERERLPQGEDKICCFLNESRQYSNSWNTWKTTSLCC